MFASRFHFMAAVAAAGLFSMGSLASAADYYYTVSPSDVGASGSAFTWDGAAQGDATTGAGGQFGSSSFVSNIDGSSSKYNTLYFDLNTLLHTSGLTVGDLQGWSYSTRNTSGTTLDWAARIYTVNAVSGGTWYDERFNGINPPVNGTGWNPSDTNTANWFATYTDGTDVNNPVTLNESLSQLAADSRFSSHQILYTNMYAGSTTNAAAIFSNLDGIVITAGGNTAHINLVPEPASLSLLALGGLALLGRRRRA
jgi:hypothetical protein